MEGDDLDNFIYKNYKERTNEQDLEIRWKLVEVSSSREKKNSKDPETARKTEARWVTQKEGSENVQMGKQSRNPNKLLCLVRSSMAQGMRPVRNTVPAP